MIARSQHEGALTLRLEHGKASALDVELLDALARELDGVLFFCLLCRAGSPRW